jgi:methylphosphotriester-DNA--protein-cysteine methyltransferase
MIEHSGISRAQLKLLIRNKKITLAGNRTLQIYGLLTCTSGKRMKKENRVFFRNRNEAIQHGFRPCGHCLRQAYKVWARAQYEVER